MIISVSLDNEYRKLTSILEQKYIKMAQNMKEGTQLVINYTVEVSLNLKMEHLLMDFGIKAHLLCLAQAQIGPISLKCHWTQHNSTN